MTKRKRGQPTKYLPVYAQQAKKLCLLGYIDAQLADFFGVTEQTINNWKKAHPEFFEALKEGKAMADAEVAQSLYNRAVGMTIKETKIATQDGVITDMREVDKLIPPDVTAQIFWLHNRQGARWRKGDQDSAGDAQTVNITYSVYPDSAEEDDE